MPFLYYFLGVVENSRCSVVVFQCCWNLNTSKSPTRYAEARRSISQKRVQMCEMKNKNQIVQTRLNKKKENTLKPVNPTTKHDNIY